MSGAAAQQGLLWGQCCLSGQFWLCLGGLRGSSRDEATLFSGPCHAGGLGEAARMARVPRTPPHQQEGHCLTLTPESDIRIREFRRRQAPAPLLFPSSLFALFTSGCFVRGPPSTKLGGGVPPDAPSHTRVRFPVVPDPVPGRMLVGPMWLHHQGCPCGQHEAAGSAHARIWEDVTTPTITNHTSEGDPRRR